MDAELFGKLRPNNTVTICIDSRAADDIRLTFEVEGGMNVWSTYLLIITYMPVNDVEEKPMY